jgi:predicted RNase H-like nuclease
MPAHLVTFIGIDLAWSPRNPTGAAVLRGDTRGADLLYHRLLGDDASIVGYVSGTPAAGRRRSGRRAVGAEPDRAPAGRGRSSRAFARYQAGAHPANRSRLAFDGVVRGERWCPRWRRVGCTRAEVAAGAPVQVVESFPPGHGRCSVSSALKYKVKPGRGADTGWLSGGAIRRTSPRCPRPTRRCAQAALTRRMSRRCAGAG